MDYSVKEVTMGNTTTPEISSDVREFLLGILQDANMQMSDEEMQEEMIKELFVRLDNYIGSVIIDNLQPNDVEAFIKMNEENKPREEVNNFLKEKMPNAQEVMQKAFMHFREMYLSNVSAARNAPVEPKTQDQKPTN